MISEFQTVAEVKSSTEPNLSAPRNIVLCFDGTGDWVAKDSTNVHKVYQYLAKDENQIAYYDGGIGTLSNPAKLTNTGRFLLRGLDLALATGLREQVLGGYRFLIQNYRHGDHIFLFGFSRGAYTARVLAGMIDQFGLLNCDCEHLASYLWQAISDFKMRSDLGVTAKTIRDSFSQPPVRVSFMGLFDTVSSIGVLTRFKTYPSADRNGSVDRIRHAVSIEESRNCFPECLMEPAVSLDKFGKPCPEQDLVQVWFPGVHRDVGGGGSDEFHSDLSTKPLEWILESAEGTGLRFDKEALAREIKKPKAAVAEPRYDWYVLAGFYPMLMPDPRLQPSDLDNPYDRHRYFWPNFNHERRIPAGALQLKGEDEPEPSSPENPAPDDQRAPISDSTKVPSPGDDRRWIFPDLVGMAAGCAVLMQICACILGVRPLNPGWSPGFLPLWDQWLANQETWVANWWNSFAGAHVHWFVGSNHLWIVWLLGLLFVVVQGRGRKKAGPESRLPIIGFAVIIGLYLVLWPLTALWLGFLVGIVLWGVCWLGPVGPGLHADRALPRTAVWWLRTAILGLLAVTLNRADSILLENLALFGIGIAGLLLAVHIRLLIRNGTAAKALRMTAAPATEGESDSDVPSRIADRDHRAKYRKLLNDKKSNRMWILVTSIVGAIWIGACYLTEDAIISWTWWLIVASTVVPIGHILYDRARMREPKT